MLYVALMIFILSLIPLSVMGYVDRFCYNCLDCTVTKSEGVGYYDLEDLGKDKVLIYYSSSEIIPYDLCVIDKNVFFDDADTTETVSDDFLTTAMICNILFYENPAEEHLFFTTDYQHVLLLFFCENSQNYLELTIFLYGGTIIDGRLDLIYNRIKYFYVSSNYNAKGKHAPFSKGTVPDI